MEMPLPFVHRLRDLRIEQLEAQRKEQENTQTPNVDVETLVEALEDGM